MMNSKSARRFARRKLSGYHRVANAALFAERVGCAEATSIRTEGTYPTRSASADGPLESAALDGHFEGPFGQESLLPRISHFLTGFHLGDHGLGGSHPLERFG
ncbi:MAG: hypothetical protein ACE15E_21450, partial [Acidobacteriota bacterium]